MIVSIKPKYKLKEINLKTLIIYTDGYSTNRYTVNLENGNIIQSNRLNNGAGYSNQWKFAGFKHVRRNERISLASIQANPEILDCMSWQYLNGKGQWQVCDLDHGTYRQGSERVLGAYFTE